MSETSGPIFGKFSGYVHIWVGMINPTFFSRFLKGRCYGNRFSALISENWHTLLSFCALALHNGWEDRNADGRVNTADALPTSGKNLVNLDPITPEFCRRVCAGRAYMHAGLCRAFLVKFRKSGVKVWIMTSAPAGRR